MRFVPPCPQLTGAMCFVPIGPQLTSTICFAPPGQYLTSTIYFVPQGPQPTSTMCVVPSDHNSPVLCTFIHQVHKAASTTVFNVFIRFAMSRQLNVMFPRHGNILSQGKPGLRELAPHPKAPPFHFDILCNHVIFNYKTISPYFPPDTKYVAIVRDPWTQVHSAYYYYTNVYPTAYMKKAFNLEEFIRKQPQYEPRDPFKSFTNNRMSLDLGLPPSHVTNSSYVTPFLRHLDSVFHLVLIADRFDESMVLMKRLFGWTMKDIVYRKLNTQKVPRKKTEQSDPDLEKQFKRFEHFDVAVYEHCTKIFNQKIENEGPDFADELETFVSIRKQICEFCDGKISGSELVIFRSKWNEQVVVQRAECAVLSVGELTLNTAARMKQIARLLHTSNAHLVF